MVIVTMVRSNSGSKTSLGTWKKKKKKINTRQSQLKSDNVVLLTRQGFGTARDFTFTLVRIKSRIISGASGAFGLAGAGISLGNQAQAKVSSQA